MNIQSLKHEIIEWITQTEDSSLLDLLKIIKDSRNSASGDWYDELSSEEIASVNRGIEDHEQGKVLTSKDFWDGNGG